MKLDAYVDLLRSGKYSGQKVSGLCGRIIRGKAPKDFETLTDDPERKIVMLVDPDGLQGLLGKTGYDMLITVGYEPSYLKHKVQEGNRFKLVVFPEGGAAQLATWEYVPVGTRGIPGYRSFSRSERGSSEEDSLFGSREAGRLFISRCGKIRQARPAIHDV